MTQNITKSYWYLLSISSELTQALSHPLIMAIPTEPIGSIPRPISLNKAARAFEVGAIPEAELEATYDAALRDTHPVSKLPAPRSLRMANKAKQSFAIYPIHGLTNIAADGIPIPFADCRHALCLLTTLAADPATVPS
jgi:hypothetical protein